MGRNRASAVVAAAALLVLVGCDGSSTAKIDALRTDADERGLVASYVGGSCDGPAELVADESPTQIDVSVIVGSSGHLGACDSAGHEDTVVVRLKQPVGTRTIWSEGQQQVPFDGARLLFIPDAALPAGMQEAHESGSLSDPTSDKAVGLVTAEWHTTYLGHTSSSSNTCTPGRGRIDLWLGPASRADLSPEWTAVSRADVRTARAQLYRSGSSNKPDGLAYTWTTTQGSVEVSSQNACEGDQILSAPELLEVARSLEPA